VILSPLLFPAITILGLHRQARRPSARNGHRQTLRRRRPVRLHQAASIRPRLGEFRLSLLSAKRLISAIRSSSNVLADIVT